MAAQDRCFPTSVSNMHYSIIRPQHFINLMPQPCCLWSNPRTWAGLTDRDNSCQMKKETNLFLNYHLSVFSLCEYKKIAEMRLGVYSQSSLKYLRRKFLKIITFKFCKRVFFRFFFEILKYYFS